MGPKLTVGSPRYACANLTNLVGAGDSKVELGSAAHAVKRQSQTSVRFQFHDPEAPASSVIMMHLRNLNTLLGPQAVFRSLTKAILK